MNKPRGINQPPLPKKNVIEKRWSPKINKPPIKKTPVLKSIFLSNNFYFQFYLFPIMFYMCFLSSLLYLRFKLIIERFKEQLFPKLSMSN